MPDWLTQGLTVEAIGALVEILVIVALIEWVRRKSENRRLEDVREFAWHSITVAHTSDVLLPVFQAALVKPKDGPDILLVRADAPLDSGLRETASKAVRAHECNLDRIINAAAILDKRRLDSLNAIHKECDEYLGVASAYLLTEQRELRREEALTLAGALQWMMDLASRLSVERSVQFETKPSEPRSTPVGVLTPTEG